MQNTKLLSLALICTSLLAGCATTTGGGDAVVDTGPTPALIDPQAIAINSSMTADDQKQLQALVNTAKVNDSSTWDSYEFTSLKVYVNTKGQPCREYKVKMSSVFGDKTSQQTACRDNKGHWKLA